MRFAEASGADLNVGEGGGGGGLGFCLKYSNQISAHSAQVAAEDYPLEGAENGGLPSIHTYSADVTWRERGSTVAGGCEHRL
jgi:hypothetical protein